MRPGEEEIDFGPPLNAEEAGVAPPLSEETGGRALVGPALWLVAGRVLGAAFAAVWLLVAARALHPARFGTVAVIIGMGTLIGVITEGGLPLLIIEAVGAEPTMARVVVARTLRVRVPLTAAGAVVLVAVAGLLYPAGMPIAALYGVSLVAMAVLTTLGSALRASGRVLAEAVSEAGGRGAVLAAGVLFISRSATGTSVAAAYAVGAVLTAAITAGYAWARLPRAHASDHGRAWHVPLSRAVHLGVAAVLVTAYNRVDLWLLAALASSGAAGVYAAAYRFFEGLILPATAFGALLVPVVARVRPEERRRVVRMYAASATGLTLTGALLVMVFAGPLVRIMLGSAFQGSVAPLRLLAMAAVPSAVFGVISPLASLGHRRAGINLLLAGTAINAVVNLTLIPSLGPRGAAMAELASQALLAALFWRALSATLDAAPAAGEPAA